jgi:hypothetical protein
LNEAIDFEFGDVAKKLKPLAGDEEKTDWTKNDVDSPKWKAS